MAVPLNFICHFLLHFVRSKMKFEGTVGIFNWIPILEYKYSWQYNLSTLFSIQDEELIKIIPEQGWH